MKTQLVIALAAFALAGQASALGVKGNAAAGKQKAVVCAACHGADGNKTLDNTYPKLAGQYPDYLLKALKDYKSGKRANAVMAGQVQALSDADMANLAVYFGSLPGQMGVVK
ncbi:MAG: c-type cytochrome [Arenimonas sp.]